MLNLPFLDIFRYFDRKIENPQRLRFPPRLRRHRGHFFDKDFFFIFFGGNIFFRGSKKKFVSGGGEIFLNPLARHSILLAFEICPSRPGAPTQTKNFVTS
jgi:hypothetical protein